MNNTEFQPLEGPKSSQMVQSFSVHMYIRLSIV